MGAEYTFIFENIPLAPRMIPNIRNNSLDSAVSSNASAATE